MNVLKIHKGVNILKPIHSLSPSVCVCVLFQKFQDQGCSDYVVCYLRILTSGHLQTNSQFFQAFVEGGKTMKEYCSQVYMKLSLKTP